jgi:hypothetical protein
MAAKAVIHEGRNHTPVRTLMPVSQSSPHSMAGLDPAIQSHTLEHLRMLPWMAASEGDHGVVDEADYFHEASLIVRHGRAGGHPRQRASSSQPAEKFRSALHPTLPLPVKGKGMESAFVGMTRKGRPTPHRHPGAGPDPDKPEN